MTHAALRAIEVLIGLSIAVGTLELFAVRGALADDGIWRWDTLAAELGGLRTLLAYGPFQAVLGVRLVAAALLVAGVHGPVAPVLWITTLLVNVRFRGTFNGGSDLMTMVVLSALVVAHLGAGSAVLVNLAIIYVAVQGVLSYFVAGVVKAVNPAWWRGSALAAFASRPDFGAPPAVRAVLGGSAGRVVSWGVIAFEVAFPLSFTGVWAALAFVVAALVFHLANVVVFGLNRFLLTWAATWPAIVYVAYGL